MNEENIVQYTLIPTIVITASDDWMEINFHWWNFSFGFGIRREEI